MENGSMVICCSVVFWKGITKLYDESLTRLGFIGLNDRGKVQ